MWLVRARGNRVERADRRSFLVLGGGVALTIATQFVGTELTSASQGSSLTVLTPVFTVVLVGRYGPADLVDGARSEASAALMVAGVWTVSV